MYSEEAELRKLLEDMESDKLTLWQKYQIIMNYQKGMMDDVSAENETVTIDGKLYTKV
jgi:hypothetical protein